MVRIRDWAGDHSFSQISVRFLPKTFNYIYFFIFILRFENVEVVVVGGVPESAFPPMPLMETNLHELFPSMSLLLLQKSNLISRFEPSTSVFQQCSNFE